MPTNTQTHCGFVAIIGRPNVGKSTLLNRFIGEKISITAKKPQTTRHKIVGIHTHDNTQVIFVDTPGLHKGQTKALNRYMNKAAKSAIKAVDAVVFMINPPQFQEEDEWVLSLLKNCPSPVILAINKVDLTKTKDELLPYIETLQEKMDFDIIIPISAKLGDNVPQLEKHLVSLMPESPFYYEKDQVTDRNERFLIAELIREKLVRLLGDELPYTTTVEIEKFKMENDIVHISGLIWVEREGQKKIIIGKKGEQLKRIGTEARKDMEKLLDNKVFLKLWVKVNESWSNSERALKSLGYD